MRIFRQVISIADRLAEAPISKFERTIDLKFFMLAVGVIVPLLVTGCSVGPKYSRAPVETPAAYKELDGWKVAQPQDTSLRGKWWEIFGDSQLNALEEQVNVSNQNIAAAAANFLAARAIVKEARSQLFPTVTFGPAISVSRPSANLGSNGSTAAATGTPIVSTGKGTFEDYTLPFDASYQVDLWGRIRSQVKANIYAAQASAADLENIRLTAQAEVGVDYFEIRAQDAQKELLDETVKAYENSLDLTRARFETGIDNEESVAQAETQLDTAKAQDTNLGILRAQYEHALALLVGKPASSFSILEQPLNAKAPSIPVGLPSELLERRPDIAAGERNMAEANAEIGVARAAYFPTLTLSASAGLESSAISTLFSWPSRFFSVGPQLSETLFDGGLRRATMQQYRATYEQMIATYRQDVLTAFQQVEDNLASLRILSQEIQEQDTAVMAAQRYLTLATDRYRLGLDPYLDVIAAQTALFGNQQTEVTLKMEQMTSSVQLIEALGGGWDASQLPSAASMIAKP
ncbi:MAG: efflux transporter outer membrane subunit [Candidatus Acidiferrales bacterium]|jgi:NodT family efflux transporter outer membrane factor (OMF) lipoprotein